MVNRMYCPVTGQANRNALLLFKFFSGIDRETGNTVQYLTLLLE